VQPSRRVVGRSRRAIGHRRRATGRRERTRSLRGCSSRPRSRSRARRDCSGSKWLRSGGLLGLARSGRCRPVTARRAGSCRRLLLPSPGRSTDAARGEPRCDQGLPRPGGAGVGRRASQPPRRAACAARRCRHRPRRHDQPLSYSEWRVPLSVSGLRRLLGSTCG
jgi:hypothetical protein